MNNWKLVLLMLTFQIGLGFTFEMGGVMSVGWVLALVYTCFYLFRSPLLRNKEFRQVSFLYLLLVLFQALAEYMAGNSFRNGIKGIAIDVVSYTTFFFLVSQFMKDQKLIVWAFVGIVARMLIFGKESDSSVEDALTGEDATFLKFYIGPLILYIMLILSVFSRKKMFAYLFMYVGLASIVAGARSHGLITFLIGFFTWIIRFKKRNITGFLRRYAIVLLASFYGLYCIYVTNVMDGTITSGNNTQLTRSENPYNPLEIIKYSRTDAWVAVLAFMDKPLWGYGSWATDPDYKYHIIMARLTDQDFNTDSMRLGLLPGHSVIFGKGAYNGVFVMLITIMIIFFFVKRAFKLMDGDNTYMFITMYILYGLLWHAFFSPVGHLRDSFPLYFAIVFSLWIDQRGVSRINKKQQPT